LGFWGLGFGVWGLAPNPQSPIPNPQSPTTKNKNIKIFIIFINYYFKLEDNYFKNKLIIKNKLINNFFSKKFFFLKYLEPVFHCLYNLLYKAKLSIIF